MRSVKEKCQQFGRGEGGRVEFNRAPVIVMTMTCVVQRLLLLECIFCFNSGDYSVCQMVTGQWTWCFYK